MDVGAVGYVGRLPIPEPIVDFGDAPGDVDEGVWRSYQPFG